MIRTGPATPWWKSSRVQRLGVGEPLGGELAGVLVPADAVAALRAAPVVTELEGVAPAALVGVEEVPVAGVVACLGAHSTRASRIALLASR